MLIPPLVAILVVLVVVRALANGSRVTCVAVTARERQLPRFGPTV